MYNRVYNNKPYELNANSDLFGTYYKATSILNVLDNCNNYLDNNNMIALYGSWGSGKTSIIEYLSKNIQRYKPITFEAWKYENDNNLALSLFEAILDVIEEENIPKCNQLMSKVKQSSRALFYIAENTILNSEINILGIKFQLGKTIEEMKKNKNRVSFYSEAKKFDDDFRMLIEEYVKKKNKKLLIFIDDLDRCEPERVLELLSAIKHFFSNPKELVYFCTIDKNAVSQSINTRYKNVITAEEYLEKIFDINFSMPEEHDMKKIVTDFYRRISNEQEIASSDIKLVSTFINYIDFTNPRRIKKVFNKYIMLYDLLDDLKHAEISDKVNIDIYRVDAFHVIFVLYIIILFEFYRSIFSELSDYELKINRIISVSPDKDIMIDEEKMSLKEFFNNKIEALKYLKLMDLRCKNFTFKDVQEQFIIFILLFYPNDLGEVVLPIYDFKSLNDENIEKFIMKQIINLNNEIQKSEEKILSRFLEFILDSICIDNALVEKEINIIEIIEMAKLFL